MNQMKAEKDLKILQLEMNYITWYSHLLWLIIMRNARCLFLIFSTTNKNDMKKGDKKKPLY